MTSMGTTARTRASAHVFAVLAVLLGLLAMHGLASTHHAAAATSAGQSAAVADTPSVHDHGYHAAAPAGADAVQHDRALLTGPGASCDDDCPDLAVVCVAVLTDAALALLLARRGSAQPHIAQALREAAVNEPPVRSARAPDPVKELCVSRT